MSHGPIVRHARELNFSRPELEFPPDIHRPKLFIVEPTSLVSRYLLHAMVGRMDDFDVFVGIDGSDSKKMNDTRELVEKCCPLAKILIYHDEESLVLAMRGCKSVCIVPSPIDSLNQLYLRAARKADIRFVLLLSMLDADNSDSTFSSTFHALEQTLRHEGIQSYCILRTAPIMQHLPLWKEQLSASGLSSDEYFEAIDGADIGECALQILLNPSKHRNQIRHITGPFPLRIGDIDQLPLLSTKSPESFYDSKFDLVGSIHCGYWKNWQIPNDLQRILERDPNSLNQVIFRDQSLLLQFLFRD